VIEEVELAQPAEIGLAADERGLCRGSKILQDGENPAVLFG
jgi:hypothetical protein